MHRQQSTGSTEKGCDSQNMDKRRTAVNIGCICLIFLFIFGFYKCIQWDNTSRREQEEAKEQKELDEKAADEKAYEQAKEYINHTFMQTDLTLDKVASTVNVSPNYFSSLFNQETGMTFIEYLTDIRMQKAKDYLRCSGKKITEIGILVGYQDSHYFSYIFRKTQNCTPSEYRLQGTCEK